MPTEPNPIQNLLRRQIGIDAFALDGDDSPINETWQDRRRDERDQPRREQTIIR